MVEGADTLEQRVLRVAVFVADGVDINSLNAQAVDLPENVRIEYVPIQESYGKDKQKDLAALMKDFDGAVVRSKTVFKEALLQLPNLKFIGRAGVGVDNIDTDLASRNGTIVYFAPDSNSIAVVEQLVFQLGEFHRKVGYQNYVLRDGATEEEVRKRLGRQIYRGRFGVIGLGNIGGKLPARLLGFDTSFELYDKLKTPEEILATVTKELENGGLILADKSRVKTTNTDQGLNNLLTNSDYVTVHIPLNPQTKGFIGREKIALMKKGAILINDSREGIVDEHALLEALESGHLGGYITDVLDKKDQDLRKKLLMHERVLVTGHTCAATEEAQEVAAKMIGESVALYAKTNGKEILRSYNSPTIDEKLRDAYNLTRITTAFATQYISQQNRTIKAIKVSASGLESYNEIALKMAAAAGTAFSLDKLKVDSDLPALSILKDDKINVTSVNVAGARPGMPARITIEYLLDDDSNLIFTGQIDSEAEDKMKFAGKNIAGFAGKGTAFYPIQYILVEHDDMPGALATSAMPLKYHHFNIEDGQVNLQNTANLDRRLLVFPVKRRGDYDPKVPKELLDAIKRETGGTGNVIYIDLRNYKSPHAA